MEDDASSSRLSSRPHHPRPAVAAAAGITDSPGPLAAPRSSHASSGRVSAVSQSGAAVPRTAVAPQPAGLCVPTVSLMFERERERDAILTCARKPT